MGTARLCAAGLLFSSLLIFSHAFESSSQESVLIIGGETQGAVSDTPSSTSYMYAQQYLRLGDMHVKHTVMVCLAAAALPLWPAVYANVNASYQAGFPHAGFLSCRRTHACLIQHVTAYNTRYLPGSRLDLC